MSTQTEYSLLHPSQIGTESELSTTDASEYSSDTKRSRLSSLFHSKSKSSFSFLNYHCKVDITVQKREKKKQLKKNNIDTPTPTIIHSSKSDICIASEPVSESIKHPEQIIDVKSKGKHSSFRSTMQQNALAPNLTEKATIELSKTDLVAVLLLLWLFATLYVEQEGGRLGNLIGRLNFLGSGALQFVLFSLSIELYAACLLTVSHYLPVGIGNSPGQCMTYYLTGMLLLGLGSLWSADVALSALTLDNSFMRAVLGAMIAQMLAILMKFHSVFYERYWGICVIVEDAGLCRVGTLLDAAPRPQFLIRHYFSFFFAPFLVYRRSMVESRISRSFISGSLRVVSRSAQITAAVVVVVLLHEKIADGWKQTISPIDHQSFQLNKIAKFGLSHMLEILSVISVAHRGVSTVQFMCADMVFLTFFNDNDNDYLGDWWNCKSACDFFAKWSPLSSEWLIKYLPQSLVFDPYVAALVLLIQLVPVMVLVIWTADWSRVVVEGQSVHLVTMTIGSFVFVFVACVFYCLVESVLLRSSADCPLTDIDVQTLLFKVKSFLSKQSITSRLNNVAETCRLLLRSPSGMLIISSCWYVLTWVCLAFTALITYIATCLV